MKCKNCGTEFTEGIFCPECGTKNEESEKSASFEDKENIRIEKEKKINRKAILSLVLGIVSWVGIVTVIVPIICGIWSIVDGIKALKGKAKYKKCAIAGIILSVLIFVFLIWIILLPSSSDDNTQTITEQQEIVADIEDDVISQESDNNMEEKNETDEKTKDIEAAEENGAIEEDVSDELQQAKDFLEAIELPYDTVTDSEIIELYNKYNQHEGNTITSMREFLSYNSEMDEEQINKYTDYEILELYDVIVASMDFGVEGFDIEEDNTDTVVPTNEESIDWYSNTTANGASAIEETLDSFMSFPYQNSKEANKLLKLYQKALEADTSEFVYMEYSSKGVFDRSMQYKQILTTSDYKYYGEMKNGLPNGQGLIVTKFRRSNMANCFLPYILGNFKNGQLNGYAISFTADGTYQIVSEGKYEKGLADGDFVEYGSSLLADIGVSYDVIEQYERYIQNREYSSDINDELIFIDIPLTPVYIRSTGKYKDDKTVGNWIFYDSDGTILMKAKMDNNGSTGKVTIYYQDGTIKYDGEIKDGKYHGKGTLYREDGSVEYKGKFKNGEIDN